MLVKFQKYYDDSDVYVDTKQVVSVTRVDINRSRIELSKGRPVRVWGSVNEVNKKLQANESETSEKQPKGMTDPNEIIEQLVFERDQLGKFLMEFRDKCRDLEAYIGKDPEGIDAICKERDDYKKEVEALRKENDELKALFNAAKTKIKDLEEQLDIQKKLAEAETNPEFQEAVNKVVDYLLKKER